MADIIHVIQFILVCTMVQLLGAPKKLRRFAQGFQLGGLCNSIAGTSGFRMGLSIILSPSTKMSSNFRSVINDWFRVFSTSPDQLGKYLSVGLHEQQSKNIYLNPFLYAHV